MLFTVQRNRSMTSIDRCNRDVAVAVTAASAAVYYILRQIRIFLFSPMRLLLVLAIHAG